MGYFVSFRQCSFPVLASRQERVPLTPSVKILPPATAGVDRVFLSPGAPGPGLYGAGYGSDPQIFSPLSTSKQSTTSFSFCRVKTYTLPPATTGEEYPSPTVTFHSSLSVLGHFAGTMTP